MRVADLKPGLVLAREVRDVNGRLLVVEGACLTERTIGVIKAWGVADVAIVDEPIRTLADSEADVPEDLAAKAQDITAVLLSRNDLGHPFIQDVFRLAASRLADLMAQGNPLEPPARAREGGAAIAPDRTSLTPIDMDLLLQGIASLGGRPEVLSRLARAMDDPAASAVEVADIIQQDPAFAATLLKVVNSAVFGFHQGIDTISRAVTVIGVRQLSTLALGMTVVKMFKDIPGDLLDVERYWRHCLACACGSRVLASTLGLPNTERYFVAGLLHDVGILLLILRAPEHIRQVMADLRGHGEDIVTAERRILGMDHSMAGAALLTEWKLPSSLVEAAAHHHAPKGASDVRDAAIIHTADFLAEALLFGSCGQSAVMPLDMAAFDGLNAPDGVASTVFSRVLDQLAQLESIFMPHVYH